MLYWVKEKLKEYLSTGEKRIKDLKSEIKDIKQIVKKEKDEMTLDLYQAMMKERQKKLLDFIKRENKKITEILKVCEPN